MSLKSPNDPRVTHHYADLGEVLLHYVTAGGGPPVVLIHGYPQTWWEWRHQIPALAEKYTVIAPDMRGLGDSSRPASGYDKKTIGNDIWRVVNEVLGHESFYLVGHDWGGPTAYAIAAAHPEARTSRPSPEKARRGRGFNDQNTLEYTEKMTKTLLHTSKA